MPHAVDALAGSVVAGPVKVRFAVADGAGQFFDEALTMLSLEAWSRRQAFSA